MSAPVGYLLFADLSEIEAVCRILNFIDFDFHVQYPTYLHRKVYFYSIYQLLIVVEYCLAKTMDIQVINTLACY